MVKYNNNGTKEDSVQIRRDGKNVDIMYSSKKGSNYPGVASLPVSSIHLQQ